MANSLLDFVMSLVRDPDAAARYAADPAGARRLLSLGVKSLSVAPAVLPRLRSELATTPPPG